MGKKYLLLLSGVSVCLWAAQAAMAAASENLTLLEKQPDVESARLATEASGLATTKAIAQNTTITSQEISSPSTPASKQLQASTPADVAEKTPDEASDAGENIQPSPPLPLSVQESVEDAPSDPMEQVTSVSQLSDVQPSDWAYEALKSIVERYGIVSGYPDGTFRGNRSLSRYEFAAGLNAALRKLEELIAAGSTDKISPQDLETVRRLQAEYTTELATLRSRIDNLEGSTAFLENRQFSTTAILGGEVIFGVSDAFGGGPPGTGDANAVLHHLTRVQVVSSFTGKDRLRLELAAANFTGPNGLGFAENEILNTNTALLSFQADTGNSVLLSSLEYRFATFGDRVVFTLKPIGFSLSSVLSTNSPYFDAGRGAISRFAEANPVFKIGALDAGVGVDWLLNRRIRFQAAYGASNANDPKIGFVSGSGAYATGAQLLILPGNDVLAGITYVYGYSPDGRLNTFTGSEIADSSGGINQPSNIHAVSGTLQWRIAPKVTFATWGGFTGTYAAGTDAYAVSSNYMFSLGFSDPFGHEGDLLALMFGQPPKLNRASVPVVDNASSFHIEAFYRYAVNDRISITPGFFVVTNPENFEPNKTIYVGTIRTSFRF